MDSLPCLRALLARLWAYAASVVAHYQPLAAGAAVTFVIQMVVLTRNGSQGIAKPFADWLGRSRLIVIVIECEHSRGRRPSRPGALPLTVSAFMGWVFSRSVSEAHFEHPARS
jgi:hypothetical protein